MLFTALLFTPPAQAQIEVINPENPKKTRIQTYTPAFLRTYKDELIAELNSNIKHVNGMAGCGAWYGLTALDDRIETHSGVLFYYKDMANKTIKLYFEEKSDEGEVAVQGVTFVFDKKDVAQAFAEQLYTVAHHSYQELNVDSILTVFKPVAEQYQAAETKPSITEEQRKYIIQANALNEEKKYSEALELYKKAMKLNPVSYPPAYNNMALIAAQMGMYKYAILNMKKYLMLTPSAEDARAAQDKIYVWELKL